MTANGGEVLSARRLVVGDELGVHHPLATLVRRCWMLARALETRTALPRKFFFPALWALAFSKSAAHAGLSGASWRMSQNTR